MAEGNFIRRGSGAAQKTAQAAPQVESPEQKRIKTLQHFLKHVFDEAHPQRAQYQAELDRLLARKEPIPDAPPEMPKEEPSPAFPLKVLEAEAPALDNMLAAEPAEPPALGKIVHLPVWPEAVRGMPNGLLRTALFGVVERGGRRYMQVEPIAAVNGIEILYTGQQLDQGDLDVWQAVLHFCRLQAMGRECRFSAYAFLKALGKTVSGASRKVLDTQLTRLKATAVRIRLVGRYSYEGSLLDEIYRDEKTKEYVAVLNPKMRALFEPDQFTQIEWSVRHALSGKPLAQWLHGFFSSHAAPHPISIEKLRELSGSEAKRERKFKETLRKALDAVVEASEAHGQPFRFTFEGDLVCIERTPSDSQRRHLAARSKKRPPRR